MENYIFLRLNIPYDDNAMTIEKRSRRGWRCLARVTWYSTHPRYALALFLSVPLDGSKHTAVTFCFSRFSFSSCLLLCSFRRCTLLLRKARGTEYAHVPGTINELTATDTSSSSRPILLPFFLFPCFRIFRRSLWFSFDSQNQTSNIEILNSAHRSEKFLGMWEIVSIREFNYSWDDSINRNQEGECFFWYAFTWSSDMRNRCELFLALSESGTDWQSVQLKPREVSKSTTARGGRGEREGESQREKAMK